MASQRHRTPSIAPQPVTQKSLQTSAQSKQYWRNQPQGNWEDRPAWEVEAAEPYKPTDPMFRGLSQEWMAAGMVIQPKLTIGQPNDKYEQEADRIAKQVVQQMDSPNPGPQVNGIIGKPTIQREEKDKLQKKTAIGSLAGAIPASTELEAAIHQARSGGQPLPDRIRQPMEQAFGADFSRVRVHTDAQADRLNRSIQAKAFTTGQGIFFRQGAYQLNSNGGQELIAHELTHVVQQNGQQIQREPARSIKPLKEAIFPPSSPDHEDPWSDIKAEHGRKAAPPQASNNCNPSVIQRTIWKYTADNKWVVEEPGTTGEHEKPAIPMINQFFNDVTGKSGEDIGSVRAGLLDRMMQTGSVQDMGETVTLSWADLAAELIELSRSEDYEAVVKKEDGLLEIGTIQLDKAQKVTSATKIITKVPEVMDDVTDFVITFMRNNGQLAYIERQPWFVTGKSNVDIDLNFYYDRGIEDSGELGMHKDTAGDNLFVNLIFNNPTATPATEWTQDRQKPSGYKKATMEALMPKEMVEDITAAKQQLEEESVRVGGKNRIEGGMMGSYAYVSWVDELIWHSTPTLANRPYYGVRDKARLLMYLEKKSIREVAKEEAHREAEKYAIETVKEMIQTGRVVNDVGDYIPLVTKIYNKEYVALKEKYAADLPQDLYEAMTLLLADANGQTKLLWLAVQKWQEDFSMQTWKRFMRWLFEEGNQDLVEVVREEIIGYDWSRTKMSGRTGEEIAKDERGVARSSVVPTNVMMRERSNSNPHRLAVLKEAALVPGTQRYKRRSFLRTWVRVDKGMQNGVHKRKRSN